MIFRSERVNCRKTRTIGRSPSDLNKWTTQPDWRWLDRRVGNRWVGVSERFFSSSAGVVGFANSRRRKWEKELGFQCVRERSAQMKIFFFKNISWSRYQLWLRVAPPLLLTKEYMCLTNSERKSYYILIFTSVKNGKLHFHLL